MVERPPPTEVLRDGDRVEKTLATGHQHDFGLQLMTGSMLKVVAVQHEVDLTLTLLDQDRVAVAFSDSNNGTDGPEWLLYRVAQAQDHVLRVQGIDGAGTYSLEIESELPSKGNLALLGAIEVLDAKGPLEEAESLLSDDSAPLPGLTRARLHSLSGRLLRDHGRPLEALHHLEEAAEAFARHGNAFEHAPALNALGHLRTELGHESAEETLVEALRTAAQVDHLRATRVAWNNLGILYASRGDHSAALDAYRRALEVVRLLDDPDGIADNFHNLGVEMIFLGRFVEGIELLRKAVEARREISDPLGEARSLASLGWGLGLYSLASDSAETAAYLSTFDRAIQSLEEVGARHDLAIALEQRGQLRRRHGDLEGARQDLNRALDLSNMDNSDRLHGAWLLAGLGGVSRGKGELSRSESELRHAASEFDAMGHRSGQIISRAELARTLRSLGDRKGAAQALEEALSVIEETRSGLRVPELRSTFLGGQQEIFTELVDLWAEAAWEAPNEVEFAQWALTALERGKARSLLDQLAVRRQPTTSVHDDEQKRLEGVLSALETRLIAPPRNTPEVPEVRRAASDDHSLESIRQARLNWLQAREGAKRQVPGRPTSVEPLGAEAIPLLLDAGTALLALSLGPDRSWLFLITDTSIKVFPLAAREELEATASRAYDLLPLEQTRGYAAATRITKRQLADLVLGPVWQHLSYERLVFAADGMLHLIPLGLLPDPEGRLLLDRFETVQLPSASVLSHLRQRRASRSLYPSSIALVADPVFSPFDLRLGQNARQPDESSERSYLHRLPATAEEAQEIAALASTHLSIDPQIFSAFEANRELITGGGLNDYRLLHFATHGLVDAGDSALASLVLSLYSPDGTPRSGLLPARDLFDLELGADLVVLSACRTAIGQPIRGEGLVGLSQGFLAAGASHLVVSLWDVDDRSTADLMVHFYDFLFEQGGAPARALRRAQLEFERQNPGSSSRWGAFIAIGDWGLSLDLHDVRARNQEFPSGAMR